MDISGESVALPDCGVSPHEGFLSTAIRVWPRLLGEEIRYKQIVGVASAQILYLPDLRALVGTLASGYDGLSYQQARAHPGCLGMQRLVASSLIEEHAVSRPPHRHVHPHSDRRCKVYFQAPSRL